jgi:hypothetical protein
MDLIIEDITVLARLLIIAKKVKNIESQSIHINLSSILDNLSMHTNAKNTKRNSSSTPLFETQAN